MIEIRKFGDPSKGVRNGIIAGNLEIVTNVTTQTKLLAPVNKQKGIGGQLRNSYMFKTLQAEGGFNDSGGETASDKITVKPSGDEAYVGTALFYALYPEFGTCKMKPQPHFRPAIDIVIKGTSIQKVLAKIQKEEMKGPLKEGINRVQF